MAKPYLRPTRKATTGLETSFGDCRTSIRWGADVVRVARNIWPLKTAWNLHYVTGYTVRACEYWLAGRAAIPADALAELLRSQWGREFLAAIMIGSRQSWWEKAASYFQIHDALTMQRAARKCLKEAIDADADLTATIARADAALLQDEDFYRPHADALRAMGGARNRAVAAATGKGRGR